eukprot:COSAG01_NODE_13392_length_1592_cov_1.130610_2_plen_72_part_00
MISVAVLLMLLMLVGLLLHGGGWRCSGFASWERNSEVIHSEAASPEGPFEASNVASPPWTHNPTVTKINNT